METVNVDHEYIPRINGNSFYPNVFWTYAHYIQTNINSGSKCLSEIALVHTPPRFTILPQAD